ncbi:hypothetical protein OS493_027525 [Desmophyllum pertusum]|uniref:Ig-like domain-containing protein n=1 Tax=Desmophyllum pertusum TaxID=174260 RepID=A0A9W9YB40_9CNID|nr:hypothetical protein OS493_027525 [Desmophyllum pertusum]
MFVSYLALVLMGITWTTTDGDLTFTQEPGAKLYRQEGSNVALTWDYKVDKIGELEYIIWRVYNKTEMKTRNLIVEYKKFGYVRYTNYTLSAYGTERLKKEGRATLVIKDITFEDSTNYRCILSGENATAESLVELIVTGHTYVTPSVISGKVGGSATFTCSATGGPSQNFTWMRGGQKLSVMVNM